MDYSPIIKKVKPSVAFIVTERGTGSGFVFWKENILVTCNHVIKDCKKIVIRFPSSEKYINAKAIICDEEHDLALLSFDDTTKKPLPFAEHKNVKEGMPILFSGYPFGLKNLITHQGIISAITKDLTGNVFYMLDGTVNLGNSGAPLMSEEGEVIGVINAMRIERYTLLDKVTKMGVGAIALHGEDLVNIFRAIIRNLQLGIGYAVPASYIPEHKTIKNNNNQEKDGNS